MAELFEDILFELETSDGWIDISPDVMINPPPSWNSGIMGNKLMDRIGSPGYLSFSLDNSSDNSAGIMGYYSPGSTDSMTGWGVGLAVRLSFQYESQRKYKFYGHIAPSGLKVHPGVREDRKVDVTVEDLIAQAQRHELQLMTILVATSDAPVLMQEAVQGVIDNMPTPPLQTALDRGTFNFPTMFDTIKSNTTATAEFQKIANSEFGFIYQRGDATGGETLAAEDIDSRDNTTDVDSISLSGVDSDLLIKEDGDLLLLETGDGIILSETESAVIGDDELYPGTEFSFGGHIINKSTATAYPRRVDTAATSVLWSLQDSFDMTAGQTISNLVGRYRDPSGGNQTVNGTAMRVPTTDDFYAETSDGVNATTDITLTADYYSDSVYYDLTNNAGSTRTVTTLMAVGKGIYFDDTLRIVDNDSSSQALYGTIPITLDFKYQNAPNLAANLNADVILRNKTADIRAEKLVSFVNRNGRTMYEFLQLEPGSKILVHESVVYGANGDSLPYYINGYEARIENGKHVWISYIPQIARGYAGI